MSLPAVKHPESAPAAVFPRLVHSGGGGPARRPHAADNAVLGTAIFLGTEAMIFAALISAFLILRAQASVWPPLGQPRLPIEITGLNTLVLLLSAYTMRRGVVAGIAARLDSAGGWLTLTAALGATFLIIQGSEWIRLLHFGLRASTGTYGATFYTLIGCHGLHVCAGVLAVISVAWSLSSRSTQRNRSRLEACQLYWLFVVCVWPPLYVLVYLL